MSWVFANPDINSCNGLPFGIDEEGPASDNNVMFMNNNRYAVAGFQAIKVPYCPESDILLRNMDTGLIWLYVMDGAGIVSGDSVRRLPLVWAVQ